MVEDIEEIVARMRESAYRASAVDFSDRLAWSGTATLGSQPPIMTLRVPDVIALCDAYEAELAERKLLESANAAMQERGVVVVAELTAAKARLEESDVGGAKLLQATNDACALLRSERDQARRYLGFSEATLLHLLHKAVSALTGCDCTGRCASYEWMSAQTTACAHANANRIRAEIEAALAQPKTEVGSGLGAPREETTGRQGTAALDDLPDQGEPI